MTNQILSNELFQQIVVTLFEPEEQKLIAQHLIQRLSTEAQEEISVGARKFNLTDEEFFAGLIQKNIILIRTDWLTKEEKESFQKLSQYIH
jgi:hypothetical protein